MKYASVTGIGIGLRACHYDYIHTVQPAISFFEILADNYLNLSGNSLFHLEKICQNYPVTLHCVGMSLGSVQPLDFNYLKKIKELNTITQTSVISDHLSWTSFADRHFHELFPLPFTEEAVTHVANRIRQVQDFLEQQIMIENVSSYLQFTHSTLREWEFLQAVAETAQCGILLDINNIFVSAFNNDYSAQDYLKYLTSKQIQQFHLAGYTDFDTYFLDTHGSEINAKVWELFQMAIDLYGPIPTVIERDNNIPDFECLQKEAEQAQKIMRQYAITE